MKWSETQLSKCRYGNVAAEIWGEWDILWNITDPDYQGSAEFIAYNSDIGRYAWYEWSWGSCAGCDRWEARGCTDEQIKVEMLAQAAYFDKKEHIINLVENIIKESVKGGIDFDLERIQSIKEFLGKIYKNPDFIP